MTTSRLPPKERAQQLLAAAVEEARVNGFGNLGRNAIARRAGVSGPLVGKRLGEMAEIRKQVMREAIRGELLTVVAQGLAVGDPTARRAPPALRKRASEILA